MCLKRRSFVVVALCMVVVVVVVFFVVVVFCFLIRALSSFVEPHFCCFFTALS